MATPQSNIQKNPAYTKDYSKDQQTISGSDLSVYYIAEFPDYQDIIDGIPLEMCKKELIMMEFDSALSVTYSTFREKFPVRSLGTVNAKDMTYGIRSISGTIGFAIFAEDVLSRLRGRMEVEYTKRSSSNSINTSWSPFVNTPTNPVEPTVLKSTEEKFIYSEQYKSMLLDQLPLFHLLIMGTTERGLSAQILIKGVTILDESQYQGTRQPNIINNVSFTALDIVPMTKLSGKDGMVMSSFTSSQEGIFNGKGGMKPGAQDTSGSSILADVERRSFARSLKANGDIERWNNG